MQIGLKQTAAPATEPLTTAEAKTHLRVSVSTEDTYIGTLITAARLYVENLTGLKLIEQTWEFWMDKFPVALKARQDWWDGVREGPISQLLESRRFFEIPLAPLISVTSVVTYGTDNSATTFYDGVSATPCIIDAVSRPGRVCLKTGQVWPMNLREFQAVKVTFKAGFGSAGSDVPADIKHAIKLLIGAWFEKREPQPTSDSLPSEIRHSVEAILQPYRLVRL